MMWRGTLHLKPSSSSSGDVVMGCRCPHRCSGSVRRPHCNNIFGSASTRADVRVLGTGRCRCQGLPHMCPGSQDFLCGIKPALNCYLQHQPTPYPSRCGVGERPFPPKRRRRVLLLSKQRSVLPAGPGPPGRLEDHLPGPPPSTSVAGAPTGGAQAAVAEQTWPQWNQRRQLRRRAVWSECRRRPRTTSHLLSPVWAIWGVAAITCVPGNGQIIFAFLEVNKLGFIFIH